MRLHHKRLADLAAILLIVGLYPCATLATGPRIKQDLFVANANPIYALDFPPFITTEQAGGGVAIELANAVLQAENINASVATLPLARMLKYYVTQEKALALIGNHLSFSAEQQKQLIFVPLLRLKKHYYIYQAKHPQGLPWSGDLHTLADQIYGADPEEDASKQQKAGIRIETGKLLTLLEKLKAGQIDFIGEVEPAVDWYLQRNLAADKTQFIRLEPAAGDDTVFVIFNKQHPQGEGLASQFKAGLSRLIANGQYKALLEKQFGDSQAVERYTLPLQ